VRNFAYFASSDDSGDALRDDQALAAILKGAERNGIRSVYRPFPDESHGSVALAGTSDGLRQLFAGYAVPPAVSDGGLAAVEKYYAAWSARVGWRTSVPSHVVSELALDALQNDHAAEAFKLLERNIRDDPNAPESYDSLAEAYQKTGDLVAALAAEQQARALATKFDASNLVYYDQQLARIRHKQAALIAPLK
jgi:tetratricopeptide (TPR) repeat protein